MKVIVYYFFILLLLLASLPGASVFAVDEGRGSSSSCSWLLSGGSFVSFEMNLDQRNRLKDEATEFVERLRANKFSAPSKWESFLKYLYSTFTSKLYDKNPGTYFFYYINQGVPQKFRFALKVGLSGNVSAVEKELKFIGVELTEEEIESRKKHVGTLRAGDETHQKAEKEIGNIVRALYRYQNLPSDLILLTIQAKLKQHLRSALAEVITKSDQYVFPLKLVVTDSYRSNGSFESSIYRFDSLEDIRDSFNTLVNLEYEFFDEHYEGGVFLKGRLLEQAYLRGYLYILKEEIKKFSHATGYSRFRDALLERVHSIYRNPELSPPLFATLEHFLEEAKWEVHSYMGNKIESSKGEEGTSLLRPNDVFDLGLNTQKMTLLQKAKRFAVLSSPIQIAAIAMSLATPLVISEVDNFIFDTQKNAVVQAKESDYPQDLRKYLINEAGLTELLYLQPVSEWPEEAQHLLTEITVLRKQYFADQNQGKYGDKRVSEYQSAFEKKNKVAMAALDISLAQDKEYRGDLVEKFLQSEQEQEYFLQLVAGQKTTIKLSSQSKEMLTLLRIYTRVKELKTEGKNNPQIYLAIYHEFVSLPKN